MLKPKKGGGGVLIFPSFRRPVAWYGAGVLLPRVVGGVVEDRQGGARLAAWACELTLYVLLKLRAFGSVWLNLGATWLHLPK